MPGRRGVVAKPGAIGGEAGEDAHDVAVDAGGGRAEGQAGDRRGGVGPDAGQFPPGLGRTRGGGQGDDRPGQPVKVAGAGVVAEAFPELEHLRLGRGGERGEIGQRGHPPLEIGQGGLDLRLLEHELRDDRAVKRRMFAPRQPPVVPAVPGVQRALEGGPGTRPEWQDDWAWSQARAAIGQARVLRRHADRRQHAARTTRSAGCPSKCPCPRSRHTGPDPLAAWPADRCATFGCSANPPGCLVAGFALRFLRSFAAIAAMKQRPDDADEAPKKLATYTIKLDDGQLEKLRAICEARGWEPFDVPYARFAFRGPDVNVTAYDKRKIVVIAGKGTEEFVLNTLETEVTQAPRLGYDEVLHPERFEPHAASTRAARAISSARSSPPR